jgi:hypothetical protein
LVGEHDPFPGFYPIATHLTSVDSDAKIVYALARKNMTTDVYLMALDVTSGIVVRNEQIHGIVDAQGEIGLEVCYFCV